MSLRFRCRRILKVCQRESFSRFSDYSRKENSMQVLSGCGLYSRVALLGYLSSSSAELKGVCQPFEFSISLDSTNFVLFQLVQCADGALETLGATRIRVGREESDAQLLEVLLLVVAEGLGVLFLLYARASMVGRRGGATHTATLL